MVVGFRSRRRRGGLQQLVNPDCQDRSDRVNGIVSRRSLADKAFQRLANHDLIWKHKLILDNGMERSMCRKVRKADASFFIKSLDHVDSFAFVQREPFIRGRCLIWIVTFHVRSCDRYTTKLMTTAPLPPTPTGNEERTRGSS